MGKKKASGTWYETLAKDSQDLDEIRPAGARPLKPPPPESAEVPPFKGISRLPLLTKRECCEIIGCGMTFLETQIRNKMIFPQPRGRLVKIPIEEIENYNERERLRFMKKYA